MLKKIGISTARLDVLVILADTLGRDKGWVLAHIEDELGDEVIKKLNKKITQRAKHKPLAYIRHQTEFYGHQLYVDHRVLEPRPESETIIDLLKQLPLPQGSIIADIGTGSGALAISAKLEVPMAKVIAIDIDKKCIAVASKNAKQLNSSIQLLLGDLLSPFDQLQSMPHALLCNLPYVPDNFQINTAAKYEPRRAIFGGPDGLDIYRELFYQISTLRDKPTFILTESLPSQHKSLVEIARKAGFGIQKTENFIQLFSSMS